VAIDFKKMTATLTSILSLIEGEEVAKRQVRVFIS
jgi:hypothetical protein